MSKTTTLQFVFLIENTIFERYQYMSWRFLFFSMVHMDSTHRIVVIYLHFSNVLGI